MKSNTWFRSWIKRRRMHDEKIELAVCVCVCLSDSHLLWCGIIESAEADLKCQPETMKKLENHPFCFFRGGSFFLPLSPLNERQEHLGGAVAARLFRFSPPPACNLLWEEGVSLSVSSGMTLIAPPADKQQSRHDRSGPVPTTPPTPPHCVLIAPSEVFAFYFISIFRG